MHSGALHRLRGIPAGLIFLAAIVGPASKAALAQGQEGAPVRPVPRPALRAPYYRPPAPVSRPVPMHPAVARPIPPQSPIVRDPHPVPFARSTVNRPVGRPPIAPLASPRASSGPALGRLWLEDPFGGRPLEAWRGAGARGYVGPWFYSGPFGLGFGSDFSQPGGYQMLPLGWGLWPTCDSGGIAGRFWTVGPCAGMGEYRSLAPGYRNPYSFQATPPYYYPPQIYLAMPPAGPSTSKEPTQPAKKRNMVVCLTNGQTAPVSDWWVTRGRFYYTTIGGKTNSVDLDALDLQKTIEENEKRGRTFILNFTPPSERPTLGPTE